MTPVRAGWPKTGSTPECTTWALWAMMYASSRSNSAGMTHQMVPAIAVAQTDIRTVRLRISAGKNDVAAVGKFTEVIINESAPSTGVLRPPELFGQLYRIAI